MPSWKKIISSGSDAALNTLIVTNGITGSLFGTSSYATQALSASYAATASYSRNLQISGSINNVDYIDFNTGSAVPPYKSGRVYWNEIDGALSVYNAEADISLQVGQENWVRVFNQTGTTITNGTPVRLVGAQGDVPKIIKAQAVQVSGSALGDNQIIGIATHDIETSSIGYVTTQGLTRGVNTSAFADGDLLFVSSSAGLITNVIPIAPFEVIQVGICVKAGPGGSGIIFVFPTQPIDFGDLASAERGTYTYGDLWSYQQSGSVGVWRHTNQLSGSYGITGSLAVTQDATINGLTAGRGGGNVSTNTANGFQALQANTTGGINTANGYQALLSNTTGNNNTANGFQALLSNTTGNSNTSNGLQSLNLNTVGSANTSNGVQALRSNTSGNNNTAQGFESGRFIANKSTEATILNNSLMLGYRTSPLADNQTNQTVIGYDATGLGSNTTVLGNSSTTQTWLGGKVTIGTTTNNNVDTLQVNGTISANVATLSNQVAVKSQLDLKANENNAALTGLTTMSDSAGKALNIRYTNPAFTNPWQVPSLWDDPTVAQIFTASGLGGLALRGMSSGDASGILHQAFVGTSGAVTKPGILFQTFKSDGSTGIAEMAGNDVAFQFKGLNNIYATVVASGNVLIGTTVNNGAKLQVEGDISIKAANLSNQENLDVDTGTEVVATVPIATYTAAFFDFVVKNGTNLRSGIVYACHDGTNVEFTETSTADLGNTTPLTLSVDISAGNLRLLATATTDNWIVKTLVRAL